MNQPLSPNDSEALQTELKYVAPLHRVGLALRILERTFDPDPSFPFGIVSSIYFDTPDWQFLGEKRNSDYLKTKIRLRWYQLPDAGAQGNSYLEAKYRVGSKRSKFRLRTELTALQLSGISLASPELVAIPEALALKGLPIPQPILPAFIVQYRRRRFVNRITGDRICIDYNICSPRVNHKMLPVSWPCNITLAVLEAKGTDDELPLGLRKFLKFGFRRAAFSKYFQCYQELTRTMF